MKHPNKIRIVEPIIVLVFVAILIFYLINAFNTQDWLWFQSGTTDARPSRIVIVHKGQSTLLAPGHPDYADLAEAIHASISQPSNTDLINIDFNEATETFYKEEGVLLELYYDRPVKFHTIYRTGEPTQISVPIVGRHAGHGYFFRGAEGEWWFGAMRMADPMPLLNAVEALGYPVEMTPTAQ